MPYHRILPLLVAMVTLVLALALASRPATTSHEAALGPVPGYCVEVVPPPAIPWGGAKVCTP